MIFPPGTKHLATGFLFAQLGLFTLQRAKNVQKERGKEYAIGVAILLSVPVIMPTIKYCAKKIIPHLMKDLLPNCANISAQKARLIGFAIGIIAYGSGFKIHEHIARLEKK